jgi:DNA (cytosine-5)-methyltransferase 1
MPTFYEFFAGGGMARAGLGPGWTCLMANDNDTRKALAYRANWGPDDHLRLGDIETLTLADLPGRADLAWGSFPCQDLSLAGPGAGLAGGRSGTFHVFWRLMRGLAAEGRAPRIIALENVCGALTSHNGADFQVICQTFESAGYRVGALVIDAALFVPQSRPRLFLVGVYENIRVGRPLRLSDPSEPFHPLALRRAIARSAPPDRHIWWNVPAPPVRNLALADLIEDQPVDVAWHTGDQTARILSLMSPTNLAKVEDAGRSGKRRIGAVYRRTRRDAAGVRTQRAEVRFDDVSGCLRTPAGGSSRQLILVAEGGTIRSRLMSARETARLMGLADDYRLPPNYNEAYHLTGDGVVVNVVRHLAAHLIEPLLSAQAISNVAA